jgi:hypothetical protein
VAAKSETVEIILVGTDKFSEMLDRAAEHSDGLKSKLAGLGLGLAGVFAGGVAAIGLAVDKASEFETVLSHVAAVAGDEGAEKLDLLRQKALQLGKDTAFSAKESAEGMEELIKGGIGIEDILNGAAEATLNLSAAGGVGLAEAAELSATVAATFGKTGQELGGVADYIAGAANASAISVTDFRYSMAAAGSVAKLAGQNFEDTAVAIAMLGAQGLKGSDAGTSLKTFLSNLVPTTKTAREAMQQLGIIAPDMGGTLAYLASKGIKPVSENLADVTKQAQMAATGWSGLGEMTKKQTQDWEKAQEKMGLLHNQFLDDKGDYKDMAGIVEVLNKALEGLSESDATVLLKEAFGSDAIRAAAILGEQGAEGFDKMAESMKKVTAQKVGDIRMDNLAGDIEKLKGSWETLQIVIGEKFLPVSREVAQAINGLLGDILDLAQNSDVFEKLADGASHAAHFLGDVLGAVKNIVSVITSTGGDRAGFLAALGLDQASAEAAGAMIDKLQLQLQGLIGSISQGDWSEAQAWLSAGLTTLGDAIGAWFTENEPKIAAEVSRLFDSVGQWLTDNGPAIAAQLVAWGAALWEWVEPQIPELLTKLQQVGISIDQWIIDQTGLIATQLLKWGVEFLNWVEPRIPGLLDKLADLTGAVATWLITVGLPIIAGKLLEWGLAFAAWVPGAIPPLLDALMRVDTAIGNWIVFTALPNIVSGLSKWAAAFFDWASEAAGKAVDAVAKIAGETVDSIGKEAIRLRDAAGKLGEQIIAGMVSGFDGKKDELANKLHEWAAALPEPVRKALGIESPSRVFAEIGEQMVAGLVDGVQAAAPDATAALTALAEGTVKTANTVLENRPSRRMRQVGDDLVQGLSAGVYAAEPVMVESVSKVVGAAIPAAAAQAPKIVNALTNALDDALDNGRSVGMRNPFRAAIENDLTGAVSDVASKLKAGGLGRVQQELGEGLVNALIDAHGKATTAAAQRLGESMMTLHDLAGKHAGLLSVIAHNAKIHTDKYIASSVQAHKDGVDALAKAISDAEQKALDIAHAQSEARHRGGYYGIHYATGMGFNVGQGQAAGAASIPIPATSGDMLNIAPLFDAARQGGAVRAAQALGNELAVQIGAGITSKMPSVLSTAMDSLGRVVGAKQGGTERVAQELGSHFGDVLAGGVVDSLGRDAGRKIGGAMYEAGTEAASQFGAAFEHGIATSDAINHAYLDVMSPQRTNQFKHEAKRVMDDVSAGMLQDADAHADGLFFHMFSTDKLDKQAVSMQKHLNDLLTRFGEEAGKKAADKITSAIAASFDLLDDMPKLTKPGGINPGSYNPVSSANNLLAELQKLSLNDLIARAGGAGATGVNPIISSFSTGDDEVKARLINLILSRSLGGGGGGAIPPFDSPFGFADGALVYPTPGGVSAKIGEGNRPEVVGPIEAVVPLFVEALRQYGGGAGGLAGSGGLTFVVENHGGWDSMFDYFAQKFGLDLRNELRTGGTGVRYGVR